MERKLETAMKCLGHETKILVKAFAITGLYPSDGLKDYGIELIGTEPSIENQIDRLEYRKKHCKNYMELKQIERELNNLKYGRRKKNG